MIAVVLVATAALAVMLVLTAAFTIAVVSAALVVLAVVSAAALVLLVSVMMVAGIIVAVIAIAATMTTAGAGAHLLSHGLCHFFIRGGRAFLNGHHHVLIHHGKHFIQLLTRFQKALAERVIHHILTQLVELGNLALAGGHTLHMLVTQRFAVLAHFAEEIRGGGILVEKADTGLGGNNFLRLSEAQMPAP